MPRFYFHLCNANRVEDEDGRDLTDIDAARAHALHIARSLLSVQIRQGHLDLGHRIEIAQEGGGIVETVDFRNAFSTSD